MKKIRKILLLFAAVGVFILAIFYTALHKDKWYLGGYAKGLPIYDGSQLVKKEYIDPLYWGFDKEGVSLEYYFEARDELVLDKNYEDCSKIVAYKSWGFRPKEDSEEYQGAIQKLRYECAKQEYMDGLRFFYHSWFEDNGWEITGERDGLFIAKKNSVRAHIVGVQPRSYHKPQWYISFNKE